MINPRHQQGISLIEVMLALAILLFAALSVSTIQSSEMINVRRSADHFSLDYFSNNMLDILRSNAAAAQAGEFNFDGASETTDTETTETETSEPETTVAAHEQVVAWNTRIANAIPSGLGAVDCTADVCNVEISWMEELDGSLIRQYFRTRTPL